jgi:hypothetical protein
MLRKRMLSRWREAGRRLDALGPAAFDTVLRELEAHVLAAETARPPVASPAAPSDVPRSGAD